MNTTPHPSIYVKSLYYGVSYLGWLGQLKVIHRNESRTYLLKKLHSKTKNCLFNKWNKTAVNRFVNWYMIKSNKSLLLSLSSWSMLEVVALSCTWGSMKDMISMYCHLVFLPPSAPLLFFNPLRSPFPNILIPEILPFLLAFFHFTQTHTHTQKLANLFQKAFINSIILTRDPTGCSYNSTHVFAYWCLNNIWTLNCIVPRS